MKYKLTTPNLHLTHLKGSRRTNVLLKLFPQPINAGLLAEVGSRRLAGRSVSSGWCFPGTFISRWTASLSARSDEFLKSFIQRVAVSLFTGVPLKHAGRRREHVGAPSGSFKACLPPANHPGLSRCGDKLVPAMWARPSAAQWLSAARLSAAAAAPLLPPLLLPVLLLTIPASNLSTLTHSLVVPCEEVQHVSACTVMRIGGLDLQQHSCAGFPSLQLHQHAKQHVIHINSTLCMTNSL